MQSTNDKYTWKGCYKDTGNRALRYGPHAYGYSIEACYETCKPKYKYFSLQDRSWCCCDNDWNHVTKYGTYNTCPASHTGGGWGNDVFEIKPPTTTDSTKTTKYIKLEEGKDGCPPGQNIDTIEECRAAHDKLGLKRNSEWANSNENIPKGCIYREADSHNFHFNSAPTGRGRADLSPICKDTALMPPTPKKLNCPTGTNQIRSQNGLNDIFGCGLQSCEKRYTVQNIDTCKAHCITNTKCKSFSWASKDGDKNHMDSTVCTLYDSDVPTQEWGPNQIMCGLDNAALQQRTQQQTQEHVDDMKEQQKEHFGNMKETHEKGMNAIQTQQKEHQKQMETKLADMQTKNKQQMNKQMNEHKKTMNKHMSGMKDELLKTMKESFNKNNQQNVLLQKINDLKDKQSELDIKHQTLQQLKQQRKQLNQQTKNIMQRQNNWERQRAISRQKRMVERQKLMKQQHEMALDENYQLMNGLKGFLQAFSNLYKHGDMPEPDAPMMSIGGPAGTMKSNIPAGDGKRYETRYTKFGKFNRPPPLLPPIPPLPRGMNSVISGRRFLMDEYDGMHMEFIEVSKCKFDGVFGELCMGYDYKNDIVSFDIVAPERKELKEDKYMEINDVLIDEITDVLVDENLVFFDSLTANFDFNVWKYKLMNGKDGEYGRFNEYIHHSIVYQYEIEMDNISRNGKCSNDDKLMFDVCLKMDENNEVIIYFDKVNKVEMFGNDKLIEYMEQLEGFEFNWMDNDIWDEIITFDEKNHIRKCINLAITKLCVDNDGNNLYVIESELQFINQRV